MVGEHTHTHVNTTTLADGRRGCQAGATDARPQSLWAELGGYAGIRSLQA